MRWVRPDFTTSANSAALASSADARWSSAGTSRCTVADVAATWIEVGNVSLLDWLALTWSLGCTSTPARCASEASTSFMFMFEDVPDPVWNTSIGKWSRCCPSTTSRGGLSDRLRLLVADHAELGVHLRRGRLHLRDGLHVLGLEGACH